MSILSDLADELGADVETVRAALLQGGDSEVLSPNYLTTAPDGTVSASFSGHIHAQGLDLDSSDSAPQSKGTIQWKRDNGGGLSAFVDGWYNSLLDDASHLEIFAYHPSNNKSSGIVMQAGNTINNLQAVVSGGPARTILDQNGISDFAPALSLAQIPAFQQAPGFNIIGNLIKTDGGNAPTLNGGAGTLVVSKQGWHVFWINATVSGGANYYYGITKNGTLIADGGGPIGGGWEGSSAFTIQYCNAGDTIAMLYRSGPNPASFTTTGFWGGAWIAP